MVGIVPVRTSRPLRVCPASHLITQAAPVGGDRQAVLEVLQGGEQWISFAGVNTEDGHFFKPCMPRTKEGRVTLMVATIVHSGVSPRATADTTSEESASPRLSLHSYVRYNHPAPAAKPERTMFPPPDIFGWGGVQKRAIKNFTKQEFEPVCEGMGCDL